MTRPVTLALLWMTILCPACTGTDVGNPIVDVDFALLTTSPGPTVTRAWLAVDRVRLRNAADCNGQAELEVIGPYAVDLTAPGTLPALTGLEMPAVGYCRFEIEWDAFAGELPAEAPPELQDATLVVSGTRADGTPFTVQSVRADQLRLDAVGGEFSVSDATHALVVAFDREGLFAGVDLDGAEVAGDGVIHIDSDDNPALLDVFDDNLRAAAALYDDDDGSGELEPAEAEPADRLAE